MNAIKFKKLALILSTCLFSQFSLMAQSEWVNLFDGSNLDHWQATKGNWKIEKDKVLSIKPKKNQKSYKRYNCYLYTKKKYSDFVLEVEFKYEKDGNSGIYFRIDSTKDATKSGMELQILDSFGKKGKMTHHDNGGLLLTVGASKNMSKAAGEWNKVTLTVKGRHMKVVLNGVETINIDTSKVKAVANKPLSGYIGLQDHGFGCNVFFRNIKVKELK